MSKVMSRSGQGRKIDETRMPPHEVLARGVCGRAWPVRIGLARILMVIGLLGMGAIPARAVVDAAFSAPDHWQWLGSIGGGGEASIALAQSIRGDVAVGDDAGVSWWRGDVRERAVLSSVRDLAFDSEGVLWIATSEGLYSWLREGRPMRRRLSGGEAGNRVDRIAISGSTLLLATAGGAVWSPNGRIFQMIGDLAGASVVSHVALRPASFDRRVEGPVAGRVGIAQAWLYGAGRLSVVRGVESTSGMRVTGSKTLPIPFPGAGLDDGEAVVDLVIDPEGRRLYLVFHDVIAWRVIEAADVMREPAPQGPGVSPMGWRFERPNLPPGASIRSLGWASGRVWLATDHGLLSGDSVRGPFRRAASPVGTTSCVEIQTREFEQALALCRTGLFALSTGSSGTPFGLDASDLSGPATPRISLLPDPPLAEIRRRALLQSGLTVKRAHKMWDRLRRRAYWPDLELRFDVDFDYDQESDADQSFISGGTRRLFDRTRDEGRSYHAAIEFDWDLGGIVYPLETVDLSRELRQLVSLRDDVADEVNQLYFERQAIRESLASSASTDASEIGRLAWRARELDAGLDAWTGGWITHWRAMHSNSADPELHPGPREHPGRQHPTTQDPDQGR